MLPILFFRCSQVSLEDKLQTCLRRYSVLKFRVEWEVNRLPPRLGGTVGGLHHFNTTQSFNPSETRLLFLLNPSYKVASFQSVGIVKAEVRKAFVMRFRVVESLPIQVDVFKLGDQLETAVAAFSPRVPEIHEICAEEKIIHR